MKKKLLLPLMAFVCAITCAFGLAACNNGDEDVSDLFAAKAENAEKVKSVDVGSFIYGEDAAIDEALGDLKFYKKLMNGTYKEVAASDMTVEYRKSSENKTLLAKPEKYRGRLSTYLRSRRRGSDVRRVFLRRKSDKQRFYGNSLQNDLEIRGRERNGRDKKSVEYSRTTSRRIYERKRYRLFRYSAFRNQKVRV